MKLAMALIYDGNFIVGGPANTRVSPNFRLRELTRKNGTVKVHRELVSALQILRDRFGAGISVKSMSPRGELGVGSVGLFAWISAVDIDRLAELVEYFKAEGYFRDVERDSDLLYVNIGDPQSLPPIDVTDALQNAVQVTAGFETSGDPFQQVTGNFDGAGLSFGPSQVNFGTGTLVPLFDKFKQVDEDALMDCFSNEQYYMKWQRILDNPRAKQIAWADKRSTGTRKAGFAQPWKAYFQAVGRVPTFRQIMTEHAVEKYGRKLATALNWLRKLVDVEVDHLRCICSLYDLCTQQGSLNKAHPQIRKRVSVEHPDDQFELVRIAVEERGKTANSPWRADCVSRRLGILYRQRTPVTVQGERANRDNRNFYLLRNTHVRNPEALRRASD
ncbi:MAG: hypothetical protein V3U08_03325 [Nitrospirales bacterium]